MKIYQIRYCKKSELAKLQYFIDKYWRKNHIMSKSVDLFNFQHDAIGTDYYSFIVAENTQTNEFDGVFGYISSYRYDISHQTPKIGYGAIWKVRDDIHNTEIGKVGLNLLKFILKNEQFESFGSLGISKIHKDIALALNFTVGVSSHYYYANNKIHSFKIAKSPITKREISSISTVKEINLTDIDTIHNTLNPYKNICYYQHRYQNHPYYKYIFWGVFTDNKLCAILVIRKVFVSDNSCLRIVDMIGESDKIYNLSSEFQRILEGENIEYIDCLNHGIDKEFFFKLGFNILDNDGDTIIPEYFEPFERKNIPIEYAYISNKSLIIFKGDGDQDRPNIMPDSYE